MADSQVKTANICNITSSTELRGNGGGSGTFLKNNSIEVYCNGSAYWSGVSFTSGSESLITGDNYTISFTPYCTNNNTIRVQFCGVADNYTFTNGVRKTITVTAADTIRTVAFYAGDTVEKTVIIKDIQIEKGETATVYRPYSSTGWPHSLRKLGTETETLTLPQTIYADGTAATVSLKGNTVQNGTPTPSNPVDVVGVGERTENLFDESTIIYGKWTNSAGSAQDYVYGARTVDISASVITIKIYGVLPYSFSVCWLDSNKEFIERVHEANPSSSGSYTLTPPQNASYFYLQIANGTDSTNPITAGQIASYQIMLNTGSTAKPYEPYGYKIPISSAGQTTPVYLGEVETTRKIRELVLTGDEAWFRNSGNSVLYLAISDGHGGNAITSMCTEYPAIVNVSTYANMADKSICLKADGSAIWIRDTDISSATNFKTHLSQQYAAGTPVTVWCVLAEPETAVVNEPLMKIGNYADEVSGITVPTITGADSFDVETTLKPSEVELTYTGWHDATVQEWDGSQWNE